MKTNTGILKLAALALLLSASAGCKTYMHLKYGMSQPKEETPGKLVSFLEKHKFPLTNLYLFSDSAAYSQEMKNPDFIRYFLSNMIFDRQGILLRHDTSTCQWAGFDMIKSLRPDSSYEKSSDLNLGRILEKIQPFGNNVNTAGALPEPDFTVVVTWAKFIGAYNYRLFNLSEAAGLNTKARIRLIWLNVDMQESWKLTPGQKVAIR